MFLKQLLGHGILEEHALMQDTGLIR